jgi:secreted trypsin-like serine protease
MKKSPIFFSVVFVMALTLISTISVRAQNPTSYSTPTPTPHPTAAPSGPIEPQIVGGQPAGPAEYPWQVAIVQAAVSNPLFGQFCGGSLIDSEWVLTAAHCVIDSGLVTNPASINVVVGINNLSDGPTNGVQGQRLAVAETIPFPGYDENTSDNDLALLHLATPATLGATIAPIGLAGPGDIAFFEPGDAATITGWGATSEGGPGSNALLEVTVPIVSNVNCNVPSSYDGLITANMLCAGLAGGGQDSCQGDSGGPLIVSNEGGGWLQAGVVSWGFGCARPNLYGVYTRVSQFTGWINLQINPSLAVVYLPIVMK